MKEKKKIFLPVLPFIACPTEGNNESIKYVARREEENSYEPASKEVERERESARTQRINGDNERPC